MQYEDAIKPLLAERNRRLKRALVEIRAANPKDRHVINRAQAAELIGRAAQSTDVRALDMQIEAMQTSNLWQTGSD